MSEEVNKQYVFAFVVDGEIAWLHGFDYRAEQAIAAMQSNPVVVECPQEIVNQMIPNGIPNYIGWTYADGVYTPPV
jgi:hypothetical protein